jgi:hypothetical protein
MRLAIVGSRGFPKLDQVRRYVQGLPKDTVVISGGARGVDEVAAEEARACGLEVEIYFPQYDVYGRSATFKRNDQIVEACDKLIAFWDGTSRGTTYTFTKASRDGKLLEVVRPMGDA